ncbi:hypothetical protein ACOMHN_023643 [Nucella lapillus]
MERGMKKIKFGQEVFYGPTPDDVPYVKLSPLDEDIIVSYTGPDNGLMYAESVMETTNGNPGPVAGCKTWTRKEPQAYGLCLSLYEQHPISMKMSGEPIADSFAICARKNNTILLIADGVNWGEKSRLAARCALYGSMRYLNYKIFDKRQHPTTTQDMTALLRKSLDEAHRAILARDGGLTTMCACMVAPVDNSDQHAVCCVNVGDSYGFVYSNNQGIREVTVGSHDVSSERDIRDAGGAIGPVDGQNPELHNLTCSVTFCNRGDIVFLSTDGISDNYDPVVTKIALPQKADDTNFNKNSPNNPNGSIVIDKPAMSPKERHVYSMKEMERVIHEYELLTEEMCSAQEFCSAMVQHVLTVTDGKRKILENPALYAKRKMTNTDRKRRDTEIVEKMSKAPGKLDHASIVAVEVCGFVVKEEEEEGVVVEGETDNSAAQGEDNGESLSRIASPTSPTSPSVTPKKSGARKLLSKLKNLPSPTSSSSSPATSPLPHHHHLSPKSPGSHRQQPQSPLALHLSPRKFHKRGRQRFNSEPETPASPTIPESPFESEKCVVSSRVRGVVSPYPPGGCVASSSSSCGNRDVSDCGGGCVACSSSQSRVTPPCVAMSEDVTFPGDCLAECSNSRAASSQNHVNSCSRRVACEEVASPVAASVGRRTIYDNVASSSRRVAFAGDGVDSSPDHRVTPSSHRHHRAPTSGRIVPSPARATSPGKHAVSSPGKSVVSSSGRIVPSPARPVATPSQGSDRSGHTITSPRHQVASPDQQVGRHRDSVDGGEAQKGDGRPCQGLSGDGRARPCRGLSGDGRARPCRGLSEVSANGSLASSPEVPPSSPSSPVFVDPSSPSEGPLRLRSHSRRSQVVSQCIAVESSL